MLRFLPGPSPAFSISFVSEATWLLPALTMGTLPIDADVEIFKIL